MAIVDVIKYEGKPDVLVWKYPNDELGTWTQLIVNEAQEAILFKGGKALDVFSSGRHTLSTENIPILNKIVNLPFGGKSPFKAEVWYVNKLHTLDIKWGTSTPIQLLDPKYKVLLPVRAFGQFGIQIEDSQKFLTKLVGTLKEFNKENLVEYFRGIFITKSKDAIATYVVEKQITVLEINAYLEEISECLKENIKPILEEYGIKLLNFLVNSINVPEEDSAVIKLKSALAKRAEMDIVGYSYGQERSFDTLEGAAKNEGSGASNIMGAGMGLGMGFGLGGNMSNQFGNLAQDINTKDIVKCKKCGKEIEITAKFCPECGTSNNNDSQDEMECLGCKCKISKKAKFCPECGAPTVKKCTKCGIEVSPNNKFCPECGEKL